MSPEGACATSGPSLKPGPLIAALGRVRALVVGDLVADEYVFGQTERVSREAPVLIVRHEASEVRLGGGANVAHNASALGAKVRAVGVVGDDPSGRSLRRLFRAARIELRAVGGRGVVTETKTRVLAGGISTTRQQMLRIDRGAQGPLPARVRAALVDRVRASLAWADVAVASDYGAGALGDEVREELLAWAHRGGTLVVDSRFALPRYRGATVVKPNEPELSALTGLPVRTDAELRAAARVALEQLAVQVLLVTRGRRGMAVFERGGRVTLVPVHGVEEAVDVTGAGDTVMATFSLALGAGATPVEAARLANVAGAVVVQKQGTATASPAELARALRSAP